MKRSRASHRVWVAVRGVLSLWTAGLVGACGALTTDMTAAFDAESLTEAQAVVNGTETSAYPAVGALMGNIGYGWEQFCTATLIKDRWVLTAAHCADPEISGLSINSVAFFVGPDVTAPGEFYPADQATIHPSWDSYNLRNDIALIHLGSTVPASVATPIPINTTDVAPGNTIRFIGYGVSEPDGYGGGGGSGTKRTGVSVIDQVATTSYLYSPGTNDAMTCNGDSGGPDLVGASGSERISGITSAGDQYCATDAQSTRVDAFETWIVSVVGSFGPTGCDLRGGDCTGEACVLATGGETADCHPSDNAALGQACVPMSTAEANAPCIDGAFCASLTGGARCREACYSDGDCDGDTCVRDLAEVSIFGVCVPTCTIPNSGCPGGTACFPQNATTGLCLPSAGVVRDQGCDPNPSSETTPIPCNNGLICVPTGSANEHSGVCKETCVTSPRCGTGSVCRTTTLWNGANVGYCDDAVGSCLNGAERCNGDVTQQCVNGSWTLKTDCSSANQLCVLSGGYATCTSSSTACTCDTTYSCDDACSCDPECEEESDGCQAVDTALPTPFAVAVILLVARRRRQNPRA